MCGSSQECPFFVSYNIRIREAKFHMSLLLEVVPERETLTPHPPGTILNHCAIAFKPLLFLMWICIYKRETIADFKTVLHLIVIKILRLALILWLSHWDYFEIG